MTASLVMKHISGFHDRPRKLAMLVFALVSKTSDQIICVSLFEMKMERNTVGEKPQFGKLDLSNAWVLSFLGRLWAVSCFTDLLFTELTEDENRKQSLFPFLKERVIGSLKNVKSLFVCLFVCPSQSDFSFTS